MEFAKRKKRNQINCGQKSRQAWEHGYSIILVEDATTGQSAGMHNFAFKNILPRISKVSKAAEIDFKISPRSSSGR